MRRKYARTPGAGDRAPLIDLALPSSERHPSMHHNFAELIGIAAAVASLYAAHAKTIIPLRIAASVANVLAMMYSFLHGTYPTLALNAILFPLNAWRLRAMFH